MTPHLYENSYNAGLVSISKSYGDECHVIACGRRAIIFVKMHVNPSRPPVNLLAERELFRKGALHDVGPDPVGHRAHLLRGGDRLHVRLRPTLEEAAMIFDYSLAALVSVGITIYLVYALLKPEQF